MNKEYVKDEGYIKFDCQHTHAKWCDPCMPLMQDVQNKLTKLDALRTVLYRASLIGKYANGIGYGNISMRAQENFIISASATGGKEFLGLNGYCLIPKTDICSNRVWSYGTSEASSETMTHAAIYKSATDINFVVHVHDKDLYTRLLEQDIALKTQKNIPYGTVEMAMALMHIAKANPQNTCVVMEGHDEGILFYAKCIEEMQVLIKRYYPKINFRKH